jgi:magnesium-transporting ATPase (P-type)
MKETNILLTVMVSFVGTLLLFLGYLTRKNQDPTGITLHNLNLSKIKDKKGFAILVGTNLMLIGIFCIGTAVFVNLVPHFTLLAVILLILLVMALSLRLVIRHKKFENS